MAKASTPRIVPEPPPGATEDEIASWFAEVDLSELDLDEVTNTAVVADPRPARGLQTVSLRLPGWEVAELRKRADRLGLGYTTYIRLLVNRHLIDEEPIR